MERLRSSIDGFINRVYDVVTDPTVWPEVLDELAGIFDAEGANLLSADVIHPELNGFAFSNDIADMLDKPENVRVVKAEEPVYPLAPRIMEQQRFHSWKDVLQTYEASEKKTLDLAPLNAWLAKDYKIEERYSATLNQSPHYTDFLTVHLSGPAARSLDQQRLKELNRLLPHVARATEFNRPFTLLESRYRTILDALDRLKLGVLIIGSDRSIWLRNETGTEVLERGDSLKEDLRGRVAGVSPDADEMLSMIFDSVEESREAVPVHLPRRSKRDAYVADVSPISNSEVLPRSGMAGYIFLIVDPDQHQLTDVSGMAQLYGLSEAERRVGELVIQGFSNREIAEIRRVKLETVRTQVRSILQKTRTAKRTELIRLACKVRIPIG